ncbi:metallophosphoesterase family protein [Anditalea andensis]|uniref:Phosphoesterase n=1 Tax=Anditalea andensis TaxID=1048983 RepID=A0A074KTZ7_9BACT|nr:metallophosphoesterase family protein [Anditalea andensis]KEO72389.1 phosphodiesterase [Anditalea andensis]
MKKIGLISDSHGYIDEKVIGHLADVDEIWHAGDVGDMAILNLLPGDKKLRAVFGNIDDQFARIKFLEEEVFEIEGVKVYMVHIGGTPPRYAKGIKKRILEIKPKLFICGHSHICRVEFDQTTKSLYMNPGAIGVQGFHQVRTMLKFELEDGEIKNLIAVELGKRAK